MKANGCPIKPAPDAGACSKGVRFSDISLAPIFFSVSQQSPRLPHRPVTQVVGQQCHMRSEK